MICKWSLYCLYIWAHVFVYCTDYRCVHCTLLTGSRIIAAGLCTAVHSSRRSLLVGAVSSQQPSFCQLFANQFDCDLTLSLSSSVITDLEFQSVFEWTFRQLWIPSVFFPCSFTEHAILQFSVKPGPAAGLHYSAVSQHYTSSMLHWPVQSRTWGGQQ